MIKFLLTRLIRLLLVACLVCTCMLVRGQQVTRVEYFLDTDPGFGKGVNIPVSAGQDVTGTFSVGIGQLPSGFHNLHIRSFAPPVQVIENEKTVTKGGWSLSSIKSFYKQDLNLNSSEVPNIVKGEYFLDADPGFGNGVNIPVSRSKNLNNVRFVIDVTNLENGFHHLNVRFQNEQGGWSLSPVRTFYKTGLENIDPLAIKIVKGEYFVDTDPGFGNATPIPFTAGADVTDIMFPLDLTSLTPGLHNLYTRFKDSNGSWSLSTTHTFYNESLTDTDGGRADIVKGEYYIDSDPGFGKGVNIPVVASPDPATLSFPVNITSLTTGFHNIYIRFRDSKGKWSLTPTRTFYKENFTPGIPVPNVAGGEYFIGNDPGFGKGTPINVSPAPNLSQVGFAVDISSLEYGFHNLSVRFRDTGKSWGLTSIRAFYKERFDQTVLPFKVQKLEYFVDTDPGLNKGKEVPVTPSVDLTNVAFEVNVESLELGQHVLYLRAVDEKGRWSLLNNRPFRVDPPSGLFITVGQLSSVLCIGSPIDVPFTVNGPFSENNVFTAQLSDKDGGFSAPINIGTLEATGSGTIKATVPYAATGTNYRIRVTASAPSSNSLSNNQPLTLNPVPANFSITGDTVTCIGTRTYSLTNYEPGSGKYLWNLSGGGTIDTAGITATVNWTTAGSYNLKVKYTGVCAGNDSVKVLKVSVIDQPLTGTFEGMQPADGNENLSLPITFSWLPIANATTYDLYIWEEGAQKPANPAVSNLSAINYVIHSTGVIQYEKTYKWQIRARRACSEILSAIQTFKLRYFPDLTVSNVVPASSGFSGQAIGIQWEVKNSGLGGTLQGQWSDYVYLSTDAIFDPETDIYLGNSPNVSELKTGESYTQTAAFNLPQGISNNYYVFVIANNGGTLEESDETNNAGVSTVTTAIQLTPPPDLRVTSIVPPNFVFSGQNMAITWKVNNSGTGSTRAESWSDDIYLSKDSVLNFSNADHLGGVTHHGALDAGKNYTASKTVKLPEGIFGRHYLFIRTDVSNQVYEHASENNNTTRSDSIQIILTPPVDLAVTSLTVARPTVSNRESLNIKWRVENAGGSGTENNGWADNVYLSKDSVFVPASAISLSSFSRPAALPPGEGYDADRNVQIPANLNGDYFVYVFTDAGKQVYEYDLEENNIRRSSETIRILSPDLVISGIDIPVQDTSAHAFEVKWIVKNNADGALETTSLSDRVTYSADSVFKDENQTELTVLTYTSGNIAANGTVSKSAMVKFPEGVAGDFYIYVHTDHKNGIFEAGRDSNNISRAPSPIKIHPNLLANLFVSEVGMDRDSVFAGATVPITYRIVNKGMRVLSGFTWSDRIYISAEAEWSAANSILLKETLQSNVLLADSGYTVKTNIVIPSQAITGNYHLFVITDAGNTVPEPNGENDNIAKSSSFYVKQYPPVDLTITSLNAPVESISATSVTVGWSVQNIGQAITLQSRWDDAFYLSRDMTWNKDDDVMIKAYGHNGTLAANQSYSNQQTVIIPNGVSGTYYLLLVTDHSDFNSDANLGNNAKVVTQGDGGEPLKLQITLSPPSDLVVTSLTIPSNGQAGQPVTVKWTVKNQGTGATASDSWTERLYFSTNATIDAGDQVVGSYLRQEALAGGAQYTDTLVVFLPFNAQGNYYILFKTDANDNIFEYQAEQNNVAQSVMTVAKAPISDLVVSEIIIPETAIVGENITIQWKLRNLGAFEASGYMKDAVYLSEDAVRDVSDLLLVSQSTGVNIPAQGEELHTFSGELKGASLKNYHVLVYTDILNNINESNDANNSLASTSKITVTVRELPINVPTARTMSNGQEIYYRIEIPGSLSGETLLVTLDGDDLRGANEIYIRHGQVPTRAIYDFSHSQPFQGNQEIIIPELKAGTYYLLVTGSVIGGGNSQGISLLAQQLNFEIRSVHAPSGGNTGPVTVQLNGSKLGNVGEVQIRKDGTTLTATTVTVADPTKVYATFNLVNASLGKYDMVARNSNGQEAVLSQGFEVVNGLAENLVTNVITPPSTRPSNVISLTVQYTNAGNTDIINPVIKLSSLGGAPIGFNVSELGNNVKELTLALEEINGPDKILRPGASGVVIVYAKALTALGFMLLGSE